MQFSAPTLGDITQLSQWFQSSEELTLWGGPNLSFPIELDKFINEIGIETIDSFCLTANNEMLAFGQFYLRLGRCHLGRIIVNPHQRGLGLSAPLIKFLIETGCEKLGVKQASLFVYASNTIALKTYHNLGFNAEPYPEKLPGENCLYMINTAVKEH